MPPGVFRWCVRGRRSVAADGGPAGPYNDRPVLHSHARRVLHSLAELHPGRYEKLLNTHAAHTQHVGDLLLRGALVM